jgi:hypothetical protein
VDHRFYEDFEFQRDIGFIPEEVGGMTGEVIGDIISSGAGEGGSDIPILGSKPSWIVCRFKGPIVDPEIEFVGQWSFKLNLSIAADQEVIVDPQPWSRAVRRVSDGANYSGSFTATSQRLSGMTLPPGNHEAILKGNDPSGTASVKVYWRNTYATA